MMNFGAVVRSFLRLTPLANNAFTTDSTLVLPSVYRLHNEINLQVARSFLNERPGKNRIFLVTLTLYI